MSDSDVSLAAVLATIRSDIAHVGSTVEQMRIEFKEWRKESRDYREIDLKRTSDCEKAVVSINAWCGHHEADHAKNNTKNSQRLQQVEADVEKVEAGLSNLQSDVRRFGFFGGATGGAGLAGLIEIVKNLIK